MKVNLFVACEIQYFELRTFSFNLYVYYLTRGFIASVRAFNLLTCAFNLPTRAFSLSTRAFILAIRGFSLLTCRFELVTRGFELVTRRFELVTREFELITCVFELGTRGFELVTCYFSTCKFLLSLLNVGIQIIEIIFLLMFSLFLGKTKNIMFL